ncbi:hypothetical protein GCM10010458_36760 [Microbacterium luteolum]
MASLVDPAGDGLQEIAKAYALLRILDGQLRYLEDRGARVSVHQRSLKRWGRVPLMLTTGWDAGVSSPDQIVDEATLDQIEALSSFLDGKVLTFDDARLPSLRALIDQADTLLTNSPNLDPTLAAYIRRLIASIRNALDDDAAGRIFDYTAAVVELRVAFQAAAEASPPEQKEDWLAMFRQITVGVATALLIEGGKMLGLAAGS